MRAVIALGGNALTAPGDASLDEQLDTIRATVERLADLDGYDLALTHGNGPQVGNRLLEQEAADTPAMTLDVLVAETQAQLGALLQRALDSVLAEDFLTVVTQAVVDPSSDAFDDPSKPVGPWYTPAEARSKEFTTADLGRDERSHRRVVPSPRPRAVVEIEEIRAMVERGQGVICGGGGGVPVARTDDGLTGVEAVVDKDYTSQLVATGIDAAELVFLTDVAYAYVGYDTDDPDPLEDVSAGKLREHLRAGEFGEGSMRPKVEACLAFLDAGGERAVVAAPEDLDRALAGETGTRIT